MFLSKTIKSLGKYWVCEIHQKVALEGEIYQKEALECEIQMTLKNQTPQLFMEGSLNYGSQSESNKKRTG